MTELQKFYDKRSKMLEEWKKYPDYFGKNKKIGKNKITLIGGKDRGATILIYSHLSNKDEYLNTFDEVNFMEWSNAVEEYNSIKSSKDILKLIERNQ